jgi:DNA-binding transcriptional ArsR family regulator
MTKVTLDIDAFKALASDTRLEILKTLDGKNMSLSEISRVTSLNKATLHEHLLKLHQAGLIKRKEREGHKWVYYKLSWKGECLLHPENSRIVVMFTASFLAIAAASIQLFNYVRSSIVTLTEKPLLLLTESDDASGMKAYGANNMTNGSLNTPPYNVSSNITEGRELLQNGALRVQEVSHDPIFLYIAIICILSFCILFTFSLWKYKQNRKQSV